VPITEIYRRRKGTYKLSFFRITRNSDLSQDYACAKGYFDKLPYNLRMKIYRYLMTNPYMQYVAILQSCRGIYAELYSEMRPYYINEALRYTKLSIRNDKRYYDSTVRVWESEGQNFRLAFQDIVQRQKTSRKIENVPAHTEILGVLTSFSFSCCLRVLDWESLSQMFAEIGNELKNVWQLRISKWHDHFNIRNIEFDEVWQRGNCILKTFIFLPTIRQIVFERDDDPSNIFGADSSVVEVVKLILHECHITYSQTDCSPALLESSSYNEGTYCIIDLHKK
jgi:hypothetical protein